MGYLTELETENIVWLDKAKAAAYLISLNEKEEPNKVEKELIYATSYDYKVKVDTIQVLEQIAAIEWRIGFNERNDNWFCPEEWAPVIGQFIASGRLTFTNYYEEYRDGYEFENGKTYQLNFPDRPPPERGRLLAVIDFDKLRKEKDD